MFFSILQLFLCLVYIVLIYKYWKLHSKVRMEELDVQFLKSKIMLEAAIEADEIISSAKKLILDKFPDIGPTREELEKNPALNAAWEEFQLVYKLTVPENERIINSL